MDEYVMVVHDKLQALTAFEDAADIGATSQHFGNHERGSLPAIDVLSVPRGWSLPVNEIQQGCPLSSMKRSLPVNEIQQGCTLSSTRMVAACK